MRHFSNFSRPLDPVKLLDWHWVGRPVKVVKVPAVAAVDAAEAVLVLATRVATLGERTGRADLELENDKDEGAGALVLVRTIGTARLATAVVLQLPIGQLRGNSWHC